MTDLRLKVDIRSLGQEGQLIARAGTVVDFVSEQDNYVVANLKNGSVSFPLFPAEYERVYDGHDLQESAVDPETNVFMGRGMDEPKKVDTNRKLGVGFYVPTQNFKNTPEMTAVFFVDTMELVATTGPANDPESVEYARLFSQAPELSKTIIDLIQTLKVAEEQLNTAWKAEVSNMKKHNQETALSNPIIFSKIKDQHGIDCYPTAVALVQVRAAIQKYGAV